MNSFDRLERTVRHLEERLAELEERLAKLEGPPDEQRATPAQLLTAKAEAWREAATYIDRNWGKLGTRTILIRWLMDKAGEADGHARIMAKPSHG